MLKLIFLITLLAIASNQKVEAKMARISIEMLPNSSDPSNSHNFFHFLVMDCIHNTLFNLGDNGEIRGQIAKKWHFSKDHMSLTIEIDQNHKFQDGSIISSQDVVYSLARHLWPSSKSVVRNYLLNIVGVEGIKENQIPSGFSIIDSNKVVLLFKVPQPYFTYVLSMPGFAIISSENHKNKNIVVGAGRMKVKTWSEEKISLTQWHEYKGSKPETEAIEFLKIDMKKDTNVVLKEDSPDILFQNFTIESLRSINSKGYQTNSLSTLGIRHLFFNSKSKNISSKEVRKRISNLVQTTLNKNMHLFSGKQIYQFFPEGIVPKDKTNGENQIRDNKMLDISLKIVLPLSTYPKEFADRLSLDLKDIGVNAKVLLVDNDTYFNHLERRDYDLISGGYFGNFPDPFGFIDPLLPNTKLSYNNFDFENFHKKMLEANKSTDPIERLKLISVAIDEFEANHPLIPLMQINLPFLHHESVIIPNNEFKYESELWKLTWKKQK